MQSRDLDSLTLRNQQLYDQQSRLDIDRERVMDELAVTKSDFEQLRNEAANLRAEKRIWEVSVGAIGVWLQRLTFIRASKID